MNVEIIVALIGIVPATIAATLGYLQGVRSSPEKRAERELKGKSISIKKGDNPNFKQLVYPNYGISLQVPVSWSAEDAPAVMAGGEFNLVSRYEETSGAIGMNFRLRPVQPNYLNYISIQIRNQTVTLERNFIGTKVEDITITGLAGKLFTYEMPTGKRKMKIRLYWIRLIPEVQFQIQCAQYTDASDFDKFWQEVDQVISSIVIAFDAWQERRSQL